MIGETYQLENGFWIYSKGTLFDLGLNDDLIVADCSNFSYVSGSLIITKKENVITIISSTPIDDGNTKKPNILAEFSNSNTNIFANVIIKNICYTIDYNCQITACPAHKVIHPKIN